MAPQTSKRFCQMPRSASRLQNDEFKQWVQSELDGYEMGRMSRNIGGFPALHMANLLVPLAGQLLNAPIPESYIPEQFRDD